MRKRFLGFALFAVLTASGHAGADALKEFTYKDYLMGFSMPDDPVVSTQSVKSVQGTVVIHAFVLEKGDSALMVIANVCPDKVLESSPAKLLEVGRDSVVNSIKGRVVSEKKISIDSNPGIEFEFESDEYHGKYRIYLVGRRLYQLESRSAKGEDLMPGTEEFLASFHLLKP